jgi:hypothetical protein
MFLRNVDAYLQHNRVSLLGDPNFDIRKFYKFFTVHFLLLHKIRHQQMHHIYEEALSHYIISYCPTCFDVYTSSSGAFSTTVFTRLICCTVDFEQPSKNVSTAQLYH